jgi:hypothetical protein
MAILPAVEAISMHCPLAPLYWALTQISPARSTSLRTIFPTFSVFIMTAALLAIISSHVGTGMTLTCRADRAY